MELPEELASRPARQRGHEPTATLTLDAYSRLKGELDELKSVERIQEVHLAQLLTHLRITEMNLGFLINFNVPRIKDGIRRVVLTS